MKKKLLFLLFSLTFSFIYSADLVVMQGGNYSSIQTAITNANPNDRILIAPGNYSENILIDKSITLAPLVPNATWNLLGDVSFATDDFSNEVIEIIGGEIISMNGAWNYQGTVTPGVSATINIINCTIYQNVDLRSFFLFVNLINSTFNANVELNGFGHISGNKFIGASGYPELNIYNHGINNIDHENAGIIQGNVFHNTKISFGGISTYYQSNDPYMLPFLKIRNNVFTYDSPYYSYHQIHAYAHDFEVDLFITNNTFVRSVQHDFYKFIYINNGTQNIIVKNNIFLDDGSAGTTRFIWPGSSFVDFSYNLVGYQLIGNDYANSGGGWSSLDVDHIYTNNINSQYYVGDLIPTYIDIDFSNPSQSTGRVTNFGNIPINAGDPGDEYLNTDGTQNNFGTNGGTHSWSNVVTNNDASGSKASIIDVQLPSTIYGIPGITFQIKATSIHEK